MRVLLADDHKVVREGLTSMLAAEADMQVVGEAADGHTAVRLTQRELPDIVLMDVSMPLLNGIDATRQIVALGIGARVIALSMHSSSRVAADVLKAGASGYLLKNCAYEQLVCAMRSVLAGHTYIDPEVAGAVVVQVLRGNESRGEPLVATLSSREREVLQRLVEGKATREIASGLCISERTVESHRRHIMEKLQVHSVAGLTKYAIREGLTTVDP